MPNYSNDAPPMQKEWSHKVCRKFVNTNPGIQLRKLFRTKLSFNKSTKWCQTRELSYKLVRIRNLLIMDRLCSKLALF